MYGTRMYYQKNGHGLKETAGDNYRQEVLAACRYHPDQIPTKHLNMQNQKCAGRGQEYRKIRFTKPVSHWKSIAVLRGNKDRRRRGLRYGER
jgi:hypothetical protein